MLARSKTDKGSMDIVFRALKNHQHSPKIDKRHKCGIYESNTEVNIL